MSLYIIWMILATFIALVVVAVYYIIYAININKKICNGERSRKKMIGITQVIIVVIISLLVSSTVILFVENMQLQRIANSQIPEGKIKGNWFQKTYGSVGGVNQKDYNIVLTLYCFDEKTDFLDDKEKLMFDNETVKIKDVRYEVQYEEKELTVYAVYFDMTINENGQHDVKELRYVKDDKVVTYPLGNISFMSVTGDVVGLYGACNSSFENNEWILSISGKNEDAFTINDCVLASQDTFTYTCEKGVAFEPGSELKYSVKVYCNIEDGDLFIMTPIFELSMVQTQKNLYYTPGILISNYANLSYYEIREYVSK